MRRSICAFSNGASGGSYQAALMAFSLDAAHTCTHYAPAASNTQRTQDGSLHAIAEVRLPSPRMKVKTAEARSQTIR